MLKTKKLDLSESGINKSQHDRAYNNKDTRRFLRVPVPGPVSISSQVL
jgi:hypothetical protein